MGPRMGRVAALVCIGPFVLAACAGAKPVSPRFPWTTPTPRPDPALGAGVTSSTARLEAMVFDKVGVDQGLPQSTVEAIFQDSRGYIWFATHQGVVRFDGYEFVHFHHEPQDLGSLRGDVVYAIAEDRAGSLWFGTQSGLDRLDPNSSDFLHVDLGTSDESTRAECRGHRPGSR